MTTNTQTNEEKRKMIKTIRIVKITNGEITREAFVIHDERGFWLRDSADINNDSCVQIEDGSDTAIMDVIRENGFEITE